METICDGKGRYLPIEKLLKMSCKVGIIWQLYHIFKEFVMSPSIVIVIKEVGLRSMRVKYKEENFSLCRNCSDVSSAMGLPTSSDFIKLKKTPNNKLKKLSYRNTFYKTYIKMSKFILIKTGQVIIINIK